MEDEVVKMLQNTKTLYTPLAMEKALVEVLGKDRREIRKAIKRMVASGTLEYINKWGGTFIDAGFVGPVKITQKVVLKRPGQHFITSEGGVVINLRQGESFGDGRHPTTIMAIEMIEKCLEESGIGQIAMPITALDIGAGSGILAIAIAQLGAARVVGIDIDPRARYEAKENIRLNALEDRISIVEALSENKKDQYSIVTANLRTPTLIDMCPMIHEYLKRKGVAILTGFKADERQYIIEKYKNENFLLLSTNERKSWVCAAFERR